jgi:uncharacterized membrane protein YkvA (DUF1232 family)
MLDNLKTRAHALKIDTSALYFAFRDPRTPWAAKLVAILTVAYAVSPIDLIPDFVPVLGYLDDLIIVPAGIALSVRLIPPEVLAQARETAKQAEGRPKRLGYAGAAFIVIVWVCLLVWGIQVILRLIK